MEPEEPSDQILILFNKSANSGAMWLTVVANRIA